MSYSGQWIDNKPHGKGTVETASGFVLEGIFVNGELNEEEEVSIRTASGLKVNGKVESLP